MEFDFTEEQKAFRQEVDAFARKELPPDWDAKTLYWPAAYGAIPQAEEEFKEFVRQFQIKVGERGWLNLGWPEEHGGRNSWLMNGIADEVMSYYRAPFNSIAASIVGPTILNAGSDEMKKEWLPRIANGEASFWLGYSEPDAGSDLGSLHTRAVADGDEFVINGQKTWSTGAHVTDYAWLLVKTDQDAPKHKSATLIIVDNKTPGISMRPIINSMGIHSFNDVFFDDVRVPRKNIAGEINKGFYYVMLALQYERMLVGVGGFKRLLEELIQYSKETKVNGEALAKRPHIRHKLASIEIEIEILESLYWQTIWMMDQGLKPECESSGLKLFASELSKALAHSAMEILGPYGSLERGSKWAPLMGRVSSGYIDAISGPIGAGTSEIQLEIIATRGLGLPRT